MQTELLEQMQATGLTPPQFYILKILDHYGASRATKLAKKDVCESLAQLQ